MKRATPLGFRWSALLLGLTLMAGSAVPLTTTAQAEGDEAKQQARTLFREGVKLFKRGMYLDALKKYRAARALYPSYKIDLNIGATLDAMGRRTEAASYIQRFLAQSATAPQPVIAAARERLDVLKQKLASVALTSAVDGVAVVVDERAVGTTPLDIPIYLEPGAHVVEASAPGRAPQRLELTLAAGEHVQRALTLTKTPAPAAPQPAATRPAVMDEGGEADAAAAAELAARRRTRTIWAYGTLGLSAVCVTVAAILYGVGGSQGSSAHDRYLAAEDPVEIEQHYQDVESAKTKLAAGHVFVGLAAVSAAVSTYLFFTRPERPSSSSRAAISLGPGNSAWLAFETRF